MSSSPATRASPAQEKSEPCNNLADEPGFSGGGKKLRNRTNRSEKPVSDLNKCLYCCQFFVGTKGLNIHLNYCKNKAILDCEVVLERVEIAGSSDGIGASDSLGCLSSIDDCNADITLTSQVNHHSAKSRNTIEYEARVLSNLPARSPIKWPKMIDHIRWAQFENNVLKNIPENWLSAGKLVVLMENVMYEEGKALFGVWETAARKPLITRRQKEIFSCRRNLNDLKRAWKRASSDDERAGIDLLQEDCRDRLKGLRRAECSRKRRWKRRSVRSKFFKDPFRVARDVLSPRVMSSPDVSKAELNDYVKSVASDKHRDVPLGDLEGLPNLDLKLSPFNNKPFSKGAYQRMLKKKRNGSKPGCNKIPYKVYKKCPNLSDKVFHTMSHVRKCGRVPLSWRIADGIFIPKVAKPDPHNILDYRQIALMNVEGKLFWSMVSGRLYEHLVIANPIIDTSCQKGSIQKMAGVWEHTSMMWSGLKDARRRNKSMVVLWLDLANAYGSIPHKLIEFALRRYKVPEHWIRLLLSYYNGLWSRSAGSKYSSDWLMYEVGIFAGCTVSVILFLAGFNLFLEYVNQLPVKRYLLENGNPLPLLRGFMDDISAMTVSVAHARSVLQALEKVLSWARMKAKASKSRSCIIKSGRCLDVAPFEIGGDGIPSLQQNPIKTLGRVIDGSLTDRKSKHELHQKAFDGLKIIDKSHLTGVMKVFTYQNILLQRLCWPLMIYEIPLSWVERMEQRIDVFLRKWLGLHKSLSNVALFCKHSPCPLPIASIITEFKKRKAGALIQLQESKDESVSQNVPIIYTGRKWKVADEVRKAGGDVQVSKVKGYTQSGKQGLGSKRGWNKSFDSPYRKQVTEVIGSQENQNLYAKAVQLSIQGKWTKWQNIIQRDMSFHNLLRTSPKLVSFTIGVTFDTVGSPANLKRWGLSDNESCSLCCKPKCTTSHILSGCKVALGNGRYRYRHDSVLKAIAHTIQSTINTQKSTVKVPSNKSISFVKAGSTIKASSSRSGHVGLLSQASDWILLVDIGKALRFPSHIQVTALRPDIVFYSNCLRLLVIIELTCPSEENIESQHVFKLAKYAELVAACRLAGWKVSFFVVEVGARGFASVSLRSCFFKLGLFGKKLRLAVEEAASASLRASFWIWVKRDELSWVENKKAGKKRYSSKNNPASVEVVVERPMSNPESVEVVAESPVASVLTTPRGIVNLGNTCFINASLQVLKPLWCRLAVQNKNQFYECLDSTLIDLGSSRLVPLYPISFLNQVKRDIKSFARNTFEDAHEFITKVCNIIKCENLNLLLVSYTSCISCRYFKLDDVEVFGLSLAINSNILQSLASYFSNSSIDWHCPGCSRKTKASEELSVLEMPDILVLQLMRFSWVDNKLNKIRTIVDFPLVGLTFQGYNFNLSAVVNHVGSPSSGHYTAFVKLNSQWFKCNDRVTSPIDSGEIVSNDAYVLIYEKSP